MSKPVASPGDEIQLGSVLEIIQERHYILQQFGGRVCLWSPNVRISRTVRRAIKRYQADLLTMMEASDVRVCPSPALHRKYHRRGICTACKRLDAAIQRISHRDVEVRRIA